MQRVTGIGGIFFKSPDPKRLGAWYREHLGLDVTDWGGVVFQWGGPDSLPGMTLWSPFAADTDYMAPSIAPFMVNFRVADLDALLARMRLDKKVQASGLRFILWDGPGAARIVADVDEAAVLAVLRDAG